MASEGGAAEEAGQETVVLASFENRHAAEHMLLSLGRAFRWIWPPGDAGFRNAGDRPEGCRSRPA